MKSLLSESKTLYISLCVCLPLGICPTMKFNTPGSCGYHQLPTFSFIIHRLQQETGTHHHNPYFVTFSICLPKLNSAHTVTNCSNRIKSLKFVSFWDFYEVRIENVTRIEMTFLPCILAEYKWKVSVSATEKKKDLCAHMEEDTQTWLIDGH